MPASNSGRPLRGPDQSDDGRIARHGTSRRHRAGVMDSRGWRRRGCHHQDNRLRRGCQSRTANPGSAPEIDWPGSWDVSTYAVIVDRLPAGGMAGTRAGGQNKSGQDAQYRDSAGGRSHRPSMQGRHRHQLSALRGRTGRHGSGTAQVRLSRLRSTIIPAHTVVVFGG